MKLEDVARVTGLTPEDLRE